MLKQDFIDKIIKESINKVLSEGGSFYIKGRNDDGTYQNDYKYNNKDKNLYLNFSNYGNKLKGNDTWTEVPNDYQINKDKNYPQINNKNYTKKSTPTDDIHLGPDGKYYMPTIKKFGRGDNVYKNTDKKLLQTIPTPYGKLKCYNLSLLGDTNPTMLAHYYKGKDINAGNFQLKGREMNKLPGNFKSYLKDMVDLVNQIPELKNFNPNYITYPQSSSGFNGQICLILKRFIYPNATILGGSDLINPDTGAPDDRALNKQQTWDFNYNGMYAFIEDELKTLKINHPEIRKDAIHGQLCKEFCNIVVYKLGKDLCNLYKSNNIISPQKLYVYLVKFIKKERSLFIKIMKQNTNNFDSNNQFLSLDFIIRYVIRLLTKGKNNASYYGKKQFNKNSYQIFSSRKNLKNSIYNGDLKINVDNIVKKFSETDTIKKFNKIQRFCLTKQFSGSKFLDNKDNSNVRVLVIDDNYSTGASIKNAAIALCEQGVNINNILCLSPGDMGKTATGSAGWTSDLPIQSSEGIIYNLYKQGKYNNYNLDKTDTDSFLRLTQLDRKGKLDADGHKYFRDIYNKRNK